MPETTCANATLSLHHFRAIRAGPCLERMRQAVKAGHPVYGLVYLALIFLARNQTSKVIYIAGQPRTIEPGQAWVTCQRIADLTGLCQRTVEYALPWWEQQGAIRREVLKNGTHATVGQLIDLLSWEQEVVKARASNGAGTEMREEGPPGERRDGKRLDLGTSRGRSLSPSPLPLSKAE